MRWTGRLVVAASASLLLSACADYTKPTENVGGTIDVRGSSDLQPLTTKAGQQFIAAGNTTTIHMQQSSVDASARRFCHGKLDVVDVYGDLGVGAAAECKSNHIRYVQVPLANDAVTVIANRGLGITCLTTGQLRKMWASSSDGSVTSWRQIDRRAPAIRVDLFGPGPRSGLFAFFTEQVVGMAGRSRHDYTTNDDDAATVAGVESAAGGGGYVGYHYYAERSSHLTAVAVDSGNGCVAPSASSVAAGTYDNLSRPLTVYVSVPAWRRSDALRTFLTYYIDHAQSLAEDVGYIPLSDPQLSAARKTLAKLGP